MNRKRSLVAAVAFAIVLIVGAVLTVGLGNDNAHFKGTNGESTAALIGEEAQMNNALTDQSQPQNRKDGEILNPSADLPVGGGGGIRMGQYLSGTMHEIVLEELGMTEEELCNERQAGRSIIEMAEERGVSVTKLKEAILKEKHVQLEKLVKEGQMTEEQKEVLEKRMEESIDDLLKQKGMGPRGRSINREPESRRNNDGDGQMFRRHWHGGKDHGQRICFHMNGFGR